MSGSKLIFFPLILMLGAAMLVPALSVKSTSQSMIRQVEWMDDLTVIQLFNNPNDYKWQGTWDPRWDPDWQMHHGGPYYGDVNAPAGQCSPY